MSSTRRNTGRMSIDDIRHEAMAETPSTNLECFARARAGD
ncbi:MAG TPA: biotin--[acetyl-CoA-carboxylase] ligase, partial [Agrobacterium sp.]|nr:biotin--[acetyl-CoA-carboxylase] ligase [Agrobacterium sp.]